MTAIPRVSTRFLFKSIKTMALTVALLPTGCINIFDAVDTPTSDPQFLSAARACFDRGDIPCALENYQKLSGELSDVRNSETAFLNLDRLGVTMEIFAQAIGDGKSGGGIITRFANLLAAVRPLNEAGTSDREARRKAIYGAALHAVNVRISQPDLRGFVRFVGALTLAATMLAEITGADLELDQSDFVRNPDGCKSSNATDCLTNTACASTTTDIVSSGTTPGAPSPNLVGTGNGDTALSGSLTYQMLHAALGEISIALGKSELNASGKFGGSSSSFVSTVINNGVPETVGVQCYNYILVSNGVGN